MFTGIIEYIGSITAITKQSAGVIIHVDIGPLVEGTQLGDSICTNGACLTVTSINGHVVTYDVSAETLRKTTVGSWKTGDTVNCERALAVGSRLGGHMVSGHVDGIGRLLRKQPEGDGQVYTFVLPDDGSVKVIEKGSVSIDGISLTTWDCRGSQFSVALIPHTLTETTLGRMQPGQPVNLEQDLIGRWVEKLLPGHGN